MGIGGGQSTRVQWRFNQILNDAMLEPEPKIVRMYLDGVPHTGIVLKALANDLFVMKFTDDLGYTYVDLQHVSAISTADKPNGV